MAFYVGQEVECIDDSYTNLLTKGNHYTIDAIGPCEPRVWYTGHIGLAELPGEGMGMGSWRFRPLTKAKISIEIFTSLLSHKQKEPA